MKNIEFQTFQISFFVDVITFGKIVIYLKNIGFHMSDSGIMYAIY